MWRGGVSTLALALVVSVAGCGGSPGSQDAPMPSPSKVDDNRLHGDFFHAGATYHACDAAVAAITNTTGFKKQPGTGYETPGVLRGSFCGVERGWRDAGAGLSFELGFDELSPDNVDEMEESSQQAGETFDECELLDSGNYPNGTVKELSGHKFCSYKEDDASESEVSVARFTAHATIVGVRIVLHRDEEDYDAKAIRDAALTEVFDILPK